MRERRLIGDTNPARPAGCRQQRRVGDIRDAHLRRHECRVVDPRNFRLGLGLDHRVGLVDDPLEERRRVGCKPLQLPSW